MDLVTDVKRLAVVQGHPGPSDRRMVATVPLDFAGRRCWNPLCSGAASIKRIINKNWWMGAPKYVRFTPESGHSGTGRKTSANDPKQTLSLSGTPSSNCLVS